MGGVWSLRRSPRDGVGGGDMSDRVLTSYALVQSFGKSTQSCHASYFKKVGLSALRRYTRRRFVSLVCEDVKKRR